MELLVVVALIGLTAAVLTLRLGGVSEQARLRSATMQIEQTLRLARHRATTRRQPVWLQFELTSGRYRVVFAEHRESGDSIWRWLDRVAIERASTRTIQAPTCRDNDFTIRMTPTGATLPWALELRAGGARRVVWTDGVTGRLAYRDGIGLAELDWAYAAGGAAP